MRSTRLSGTYLALALMLLAAGCAAPDTTASSQPLGAPVVTRPTADVTVLDDADPAAAALAASTAVFKSSPAAVIAGAGQELASASVAVALGVPLLSAASAPESLVAELDRLGAEHVVVLGEAPDGVDFGDRTVVTALADADSLEDRLGVELVQRELHDDESAVAAIGGLDTDDSVLLTPTDTPPEAAQPSSEDSATVVRLPKLERAEPLQALVLVIDVPESGTALATLRAAGADVVLLSADGPNPQGSPAAIEALAARPEIPVLALGAAFADESGLDWKVRSARTGLQLPGGGQLLFPAHLMVALYGTPGAPVLGVLGEQDLAASIERARRHADAYGDLTDKTVLPGFELIASVASEGAGQDGNYSNELDPERLGEWAEAAGNAGIYAIIDLQPGHTDFVTQAKQYESILSLPWVGLALDPEWRLAPGEKHLVNIGSVGSVEVNAVQGYLADLVRKHDLPPKLLVLHQFRSDMITDRLGVDVDRDEVTVLIHADGQGSQPEKRATWSRLRTDAPEVAWGWKNFYDEDAPMLTPEQTVQVEPLPDLITYQ
jgi:hypothetical protein